MQVKVKTELPEWGPVSASAQVSGNAFYGFGEPGEPMHEIEGLQVKDHQNKVIHGYCPLNRVSCFSLSQMEVDTIEAALIEKYEEETEWEEARKADEFIDTLKSNF